MTEDPITKGTQAEVLRALERRYLQIKKGEPIMSNVKPEPNQEQIDAESAAMLGATFCFRHGIPLKDYYDGFDCPECEADKVLDINYPVITHEADYCDLIGE